MRKVGWPCLCHLNLPNGEAIDLARRIRYRTVYRQLLLECYVAETPLAASARILGEVDISDFTTVLAEMLGHLL
jgi:hypothetical protein